LEPRQILRDSCRISSKDSSEFFRILQVSWRFSGDPCRFLASFLHFFPIDPDSSEILSRILRYCRIFFKILSHHWRFFRCLPNSPSSNPKNLLKHLPESSRIFQNLPESSRIFLLKDAMRCQPGHNRHNGMGVIEASGVARAICGGFR